mmetsp:Transcript_7685/g.11597  ORF Transcript_7685/g.11597 Transcript_7685/m.11597 type:complete len:667 (+) Transcript_7685:97-2097(+)
MSTLQEESLSSVVGQPPDGEKKKANTKKKYRVLNVNEGSAPKHLGQGISRAIGSVAAGAGGGVAALVAGPVVGARAGGASGAAKGFGMGLAGAVALPVIGVFGAVGQIVQGAVNTPKAIMATSEGKEWDPVTQSWILYSLAAERDLLLSQAAEDELQEWISEQKRLAKEDDDDNNDDEQPQKKKQVQNTELYDILEIEPIATDAQIKKAYYKKALHNHPDKNKNDPQAATKFQKISRAYEVLSDPISRQRYDESGDADEAPESQIDPKVFFNMIFGSEKFERYVGELQMASLIKHDEDHQVDAVEADFIQRKRTCQLAVTLADELLASYVHDSPIKDYFEQNTDDDSSMSDDRSSKSAQNQAKEAAFRAYIATEIATELVATPFGSTLVRVIAYVYDTVATKYLGGVRGAALRFSDTAHKAGKRLDVASSATKVFSRARKATKAAAKSDAKSDELPIDEDDDADFCIVSDDHADWKVTFYKDRAAASAAFKKLSYSFASVLFAKEGISVITPNSTTSENKFPSADIGESRRWVPAKSYGTKSSVDTIKRLVESIGDNDISEIALTEAAARDREAEMTNSVLEAAWRVTVIDVETTLRESCSKLLRDKSVSEDIRKKRAKALKIVADVFKKKADESGHSKVFSELLRQQAFFNIPGNAEPPSPTDEI